MITSQKNIFQKIYFKYLLSILWTIVILILSLARMPKTPELEISIPHLDKVVHFSMYFIYVFFLLFESTNKKKKSTIAWILIYGISFGILMEILQSRIFTYRDGDFYDFIANTVGAVASILVFPVINKIIRP